MLTFEPQRPPIITLPLYLFPWLLEVQSFQSLCISVSPSIPLGKSLFLKDSVFHGVMSVFFSIAFCLVFQFLIGGICRALSGAERETEMAINGRVHSECVNAGNPYHECGVVCLEKISQGVTRNPKKTKKKKSGKEADQIRKTDPQERRAANPNCPKSANPFHDCGQNCTHYTQPNEDSTNLQDIDEDDQLSGSFILGAAVSTIRKEIKALSQPNSPQGLKPAAYNLGVVVSSPRSPLSNTNSNKKSSMDSDASSRLTTLSTSHQHFDEKGSRNHSLESVPSVIMEVTDNASYSPKSAALSNTNPDKKSIDSDTTRQQLDEVRSQNHLSRESPMITEVTNSASSPKSDSTIPVGRYLVKSAIAPTLSSVLEKYGDIAENCNLKSTSMVSYTLECLCYLLQELLQCPSKSKSKAKELLAVFKDVESAGIDTSWLRNEVKIVNSQQQAECDLAIELVKRELESLMKDLAAKEQAVADAEVKVEKLKVGLEQLEGESLRLKESASSSWLLVENFHGSKSLGDGVL
ncbi:hypothetical protein LINGRAHAP2_LOCUS26125 [Linum grandiflorum]